MKILYISSSKIPSRYANSVHVMKMCQAFTKQESEVTLLARKGEIRDIANEYNYYGVSNSFEIKRPLFSFFEKFFYLLWTFKYILKCGKKYDFIYGRFIYGLWIASKINIPFSYESHEPPRGIINKKIEKNILDSPNLKSLVVISDALKNIYLNIYPKLDEGKVLVAHDGADVFQKQENNDTVELLGDKRKIKAGYVGSLYKGRGVELIIKIAEKFPDVAFHIIGGTEGEVNSYKKQIKSENVYFYGLVPHLRVGNYLEQFDILLAPYQKEVSIAKKGRNTVEWMSPLKIFEYMSHGKAIICSDLSVIREVLEDKKNALLCSPENADHWIDAINSLKKEEARTLLGENARKDLEEKYTWDIRAKNILKKSLKIN